MEDVLLTDLADIVRATFLAVTDPSTSPVDVDSKTGMYNFAALDRLFDMPLEGPTSRWTNRPWHKWPGYQELCEEIRDDVITPDRRAKPGPVAKHNYDRKLRESLVFWTDVTVRGVDLGFPCGFLYGGRRFDLQDVLYHRMPWEEGGPVEARSPLDCTKELVTALKAFNAEPFKNGEAIDRFISRLLHELERAKLSTDY